MAQSKSEQLRWRVSPADKARLMEMVEEGGFANLSALLSGVLLESHLVVVGNAGLYLVPGGAGDDAAREEARATLETLVAAAGAIPRPGTEAVTASEEAPSVRTDAGSIPEAEAPAAASEEPGLDPPAPAAGDDFADLLAAHTPESDYDPAAAALEIAAVDEESDEEFVARRAGALRLEGNSPLMATSLAEAELRARDAEPPPPPPPPRPDGREERLPGERPRPDLATADGRGACPVCHTPSQGTTFCARCGTNLALATETGDQP